MFSSAEMGHQLQLVGVTLLGVAMTASERAGEARGASGASPASHGLLPAHHSRDTRAARPGAVGAGSAQPGDGVGMGMEMGMGLGLGSQPGPARGGAPTETCTHRFSRGVSRGGSCLPAACQLGNPGQLQPLRLLENIFQQRL